MHILVVSSEVATHQKIKSLLKKETLIAEFARSDIEGLEFLKLYEFDLIILDDTTSFDVTACIQNIRKTGLQLPIIVLSANENIEYKIKAFTLGADDYLIKPFNWLELLARIKALIRRMSGRGESIMNLGKLNINFNEKKVLVNGQEIPLTTKEYTLLELLCLKRGHTISKEQCLSQLYGVTDEIPDSKIIDVFLCNLRQKIKKYTSGDDYIENVWGRGYLIKK